ncbi:hypothetical protein EON73_02270 [bacterium]|nr:MAG: hypothetical protein EON73_02270 [bacterium]
MIRDKFYKEIAANIDSHSRFDNSDFKITTTPGSTSTVLTITYTIEPTYKIVFHIPNSTTLDKDSYSNPYYKFSGSVCPGPLSFQETFSFTGQEKVFEKITTWLNCIWEELTSNPIVKQIEKQRKDIEEIIENFNDIKEEFFSKESGMSSVIVFIVSC